MGSVFAAIALALAIGSQRPLGTPRPLKSWVVVRTKTGLVTGHDLRYSEGKFTLQDGGRERVVPEDEVVRISLLWPAEVFRLPPGRRGPEGRASAVVGMAMRVAAALKHSGERRPGWRRAVPLPEGVFILPEEAVGDMFRKLAVEVDEPELAMVLCGEVVRRLIVEGTPATAAELFREAEEMVKNDPRLALAYGVMEVAVLNGLDRGEEGRANMARLLKRYPVFRRLAEELRLVLERRDFPPPRSRQPGPPRKRPE